MPGDPDRSRGVNFHPPVIPVKYITSGDVYPVPDAGDSHLIMHATACGHRVSLSYLTDADSFHDDIPVLLSDIHGVNQRTGYFHVDMQVAVSFPFNVIHGPADCLTRADDMQPGRMVDMPPQ